MAVLQELKLCLRLRIITKKEEKNDFRATYYFTFDLIMNHVMDVAL